MSVDHPASKGVLRLSWVTISKVKHVTLEMQKSQSGCFRGLNSPSMNYNLVCFPLVFHHFSSALKGCELKLTLIGSMTLTKKKLTVFWALANSGSSGKRSRRGRKKHSSTQQAMDQHRQGDGQGCCLSLLSEL